MILAGRPGALGDLLRASPALAARFPAVIDLPGYTAGQLATIFAALAGEAGLTLTSDAARKAAAVLAEAEAGHHRGNARLAARLLDQATVSQARRITTASQPRDPARPPSARHAGSPPLPSPAIRPLTTGLASTCNRALRGNGEEPAAREWAGMASIIGLLRWRHRIGARHFRAVAEAWQSVARLSRVELNPATGDLASRSHIWGAA